MDRVKEFRLIIPESLSLVLLGVSGLLLLAFQEKNIGWLVLIAGAALLVFSRVKFRKHLGLLYLSIALLGLVPISTAVNNDNFIKMGPVLLLALALPFLVSKYLLKDGAVTYKFHHGRKWLKKEVFYILITAVIAYLLLPFYLEDTGAYMNWTVDRDAGSIGRLFLGTNALGIWDELFFISTVLGILRKYLKFSWANMLQAVLFTSFLYELGFTGWAPFVLYPFALTQGYIFMKTDSLFYVITIHLTLDFILFLALINTHHPDLANIFLT